MLAYLDLDKGLAERLRERQRAIKSRTVMAPNVRPVDSNIYQMEPGMFRPDKVVRVPGHPVEVVIGLLMAQPDTPAMKQLVERRRYFDARSGEDWDLFFPGYYQSAHRRNQDDISLEVRPAPWWFDAVEFDRKRRSLEHWSGERWGYSGEADLLLVEAFIPPTGEPEIRWDSLVGASIETIGGPLEAIMRAFDSGGLVRLPLGAELRRLRQGEGAERMSELLRSLSTDES